mmetsp:Transcript_81876/g.213587  ORF Transcript_81876/g.213587 Transcript_81876/m.213587 type:complete len:274 (+) Transcript_81876:60-881(+)
MAEGSRRALILAAVCTSLAVAASSAALLWLHRRRLRRDLDDAEGEGVGEGGGFAAGSLPDTSVPEALHTMLHGPRLSRARAARALTEILSGEVQVLEEVLDEARGTHSEFGGGRRSDGHTLLTLALEDLAQGDADAEAFADFLLQCTNYDAEWDESDEWNQMALSAVKFLREREGAEARLVQAVQALAGGPLGAKASVLHRRMKGERVASPELGESSDTPGMLSMNTRAYCPVCLKMCQEMVRCPRCRNVGYCTTEHMAEDAGRHRAWCFSRG